MTKIKNENETENKMKKKNEIQGEEKSYYVVILEEAKSENLHN